MFAQVILLHAPFFGAEVLTYEIPDDLWAGVGDVVEVPLKNDFCYGLIYAKEEPELEKEKIKSATRMVWKWALYSYQISIIEQLSQKYVLSLSDVAELFLPHALISRAEKDAQPAVKLAMVKPVSSSPVLVHSLSTPQEMLTSLTFECAKNEQAALIFPNIMMAKNFFAGFSLQSESVLCSHTFTPKKRYDAVKLFCTNQKKYLIGDRNLLLSSLPPETAVIYIEDSFETEIYQYPFFIKTLDIFLFLHTYKSGAYKIFTSIPDLETMYLVKKGSFLLI